MAKQQQPKGWADEKPANAPPDRFIGCGNGFFGCGKSCRVFKFDKEKQMVEAENFNPRVRLCLGCANSAAYNWGISFDDLDFLMTALQTARAGKGFTEPTRDEVWAILRRMDVKPVRKEVHRAQREIVTPVGDRP